MLKVGMVGAGFMAKMHAECLRWIPEAQLAGVTGGGPERTQEFSQKYHCPVFPSLEALLADGKPDIIDICTPTDLHHSQTLTAAKAGKHVLCEKPIALTPLEADDMIQACKTARVKFMVAHVLRFWPEYRAIKELVGSGRLGQVAWASAQRFTARPDWAESRWHQHPTRSGGAVLDLHIHDLDFLAWVLGPPSRIFSKGCLGAHGGFDTIFTTCKGHASSDATSHSEASNDLPKGFAFHSSLVMGMEKGAISFDSDRTPSLLICEGEHEPYAPKLPAPPAPANVQAGGNITALGGYFYEVRYFIDCVLNNREPAVVTPEEAKRALELSLAARKSAEMGKAVDLV